MPSGPAQFIRLVGDEDGRHIIRNIILDPSQSWPPPETLFVVTGHSEFNGKHPEQLWDALVPLDDLAEMVEEAKTDPETIRTGFMPAYTLTVLKRQSYSKLDAKAVTDSFVARGAEYRPVEGVWEG